MKQYICLFSLLILIGLLWNTPFIYPLQLLVVFFHEASHALMTLFTQGKVSEMVVNLSQGGHVISVGGNRFLILSSGYLGSLLVGVLIYLSSVHSRLDKAIMALLALAIMGISILFIRDSLTILISVITALVMLVVSVKANETINDFILRLIGMTSMLYAPLDIYSDTIQRSHLRSDAFMLANEFGGTTVLWGGLWLLMSCFVIFACLWVSFSAAKKQRLKEIKTAAK